MRIRKRKHRKRLCYYRWRDKTVRRLERLQNALHYSYFTDKKVLKYYAETAMLFMDKIDHYMKYFESDVREVLDIVDRSNKKLSLFNNEKMEFGKKKKGAK